MANRGNFTKITDAGRTISDYLVKGTKDGVDQIYDVQTIIKWLRELGWKPAAVKKSTAPRAQASAVK
jgi:hypothetical protein